MNQLEEQYKALIHSSHVSPRTREALLSRLIPDDPDYMPAALTMEELDTLRKVVACVVPQALEDDGTEIDIAARLDKQLAEAKGDGWRYASLPSDAEAYRAGLSLLDEFAIRLNAIPFMRLPPEAQDSLLEAIASGRIQSPRLDLRRWFEDLCANATQIYVSHPQTLARMGYSGIADEPNGFVQLGMGQREAWEPTER